MSWKELEQETTADLIEYINWRNDPSMKQTAEDAFYAFCFRFQKDIIKKCRVICRNLGYDREIADDLANRTFARFLKYPKYDHSKSKAKDFDSGVKLYLYRFAERLLYDFHNEQSNPNSNPYSGEEDLIYELPPINSIDGSVEQLKSLRRAYDIVEKALGRLSPKHKIIYLTYKQHWQKGYKLPRHLTKKLQDELQLTQSTIQYYKKEAFDKVKEYLEIYGSK